MPGDFCSVMRLVLDEDSAVELLDATELLEIMPNSYAPRSGATKHYEAFYSLFFRQRTRYFVSYINEYPLEGYGSNVDKPQSKTPFLGSFVSVEEA